MNQTHLTASTKKKEQSNSLDYYFGDKPNPCLKAFIQQHIAENPFDLINDKYDIKAFDKSIQTTKATAIYGMHTYWSKKPHDAIIQYIIHYTKPDDLVLDPMCGSGTTALAALMSNRKSVAIDVSPAATYITKNYCTPINPRELKEALLELEMKIKSEMNWLYETKCDRCGGKAITQYTVYSQVFQCPRCLEKIPLFDCIEKKVGKGVKGGGKAGIKNLCPHCYKKGHEEVIQPKGKDKLGIIPVLTSYICENGCNPKRSERRHNDSNIKKGEYFEKYDLNKIKEIENKEIPYWYPKNAFPKGDRYYRDGLKYNNIVTIDDFFSKRNLWALAALNYFINENKNDHLRFALNAIVLNSSIMYRYRSNLKGGFQMGTYYIPQKSQAINVWNAYKNKVNDLIKVNNKFIPDNRIIISTQSSTNLSAIPSNSVDYVFTDPPYGGNIQYGELNLIWEAWLKFDTNYFDKEIVINEKRGLFEDDWRQMMSQVLCECYRVLKPNRWISLCYHDTDPKMWQLIQDLMTEVGFISEITQNALYLDSKQKSFNQLMADKVTKRDLVINFRKPRFGETKSSYILTGDEDLTTFNQKACIIIREYLTKNPGITKDHIYDELISRMVRKGQIQAHSFEEILRMVAESTSISNGTGTIERWYLKETEFEIIDIAESEKEMKAAESIQTFIEEYLKKKPEDEGVHYSDLFEYYIFSIRDKPRRDLVEWLLDYFYLTSERTYRLPKTSEEEHIKVEGRSRSLNRRIRRYVAYLTRNIPIPIIERPDNANLISWILHCRQSGLFAEGKLLYERGGLVLDGLSEVEKVELDESYQVCYKMLHSEK